MSHLEHKQQAPRSVRCAVITISDTRTPDTDSGGAAIAPDHGVLDHLTITGDIQLGQTFSNSKGWA